MKRLFYKFLFSCCSLVICSASFAQIPYTNKSATSEFSVSAIENIQIVNLGILDSSLGKSRLNAWNGLKAGHVVGNYTSDLYKHGAHNEVWAMWLMEDGRFTLRPQNKRDLCVTAEQNLSNSFEAEFGESTRAVRLQKCNSSTFGQQFFLQKSAAAKNAPMSAIESIVIRLIDEPSSCLSTFVNSSKSQSLSPITVETCGRVGYNTDRWIATSTDQSAKQKTAEVIDQVAAVWAIKNYSDKSGPIYTKSISATVKEGALVVDSTTRYSRLKFASPFGGSSVLAYVNATQEQQELHIERFDTSGFDKSIEIGGKVVVPFLGFTVDTKGKLDFKSATQENVKLWQKVPPHSSMYFAAGTVKVSGGFTVKVVTDLGDTWSADGGKFSQDVISVIVACTDTGKSQICSQVSE